MSTTATTQQNKVVSQEEWLAAREAGSISHQGAMEASGKNGSVRGSGSITEDASGNAIPCKQ